MTETLSEAKRALLAKRLRNRGTRTIEPRAERVHPPLSHAQERLWFLEEYAPGSTAYTVPLTVRLRGPIADTTLIESLHTLVARHEALRMRFPTTDDGRPQLTLTDGSPVRVRVVAADGLDEAMELVARELAVPFELAEGPLLRALLVRLGPADQVLLLAAHHIVVDGWSSDILLRDLLALLDGRELTPLPIGFGDYAVWESGRDYGRELEYWSTRLDGLPALDLPTDLPRPAVRGDAGRGVAVKVDAETVAGLSRLDATMYMTLLAAFQVLLGRLSGQDDFAVGTPVAGRGVPELEGVVGMFVNNLVMRADLADDPVFTDFLARTREAALDAYAHQELPFERLVSQLNLPRDVSRTPLVQAVFALQNYAGGTDGRVTHLAAPAATTRTDLAMYLFETPDGLVGSLTYSTDLFTEETALRLVDRFGTLLRSIAVNPGARVSELDLLTPGERELIAGFGEGSELRPLGIELLHEVLAVQDPEVVALTRGDDALTYGELDERSTRLAAALQGRGVGPDAPVGVLLEQSVDVAVALLGVLKAGGAYVPLDPKQPRERLAYMLADSGAAAVISTPELWPDCVEVNGGSAARLVDSGVTPDHLAYVIYTSGTTGQPKGVGVQHRQVLNYLAGVLERFEVEPGSRFTLMQSLTFDFGITVFYLSLLTGGTLRLVDPQDPLEQTDYLKMTPSHLASLLADAEDAGSPAEVLPRKLLILGGEASRSSWAVELAKYTKVINHYGPTEATVGITTHLVTGEETEPALPIGRPLPGARVRVLDRHQRPVAIGAVGEIYLGGDRLAREYLGRPELTADKFVDLEGERFYRTGDLGRWLPDGELSFLGRRDLQVKVRGYRVELGEIEAALSELAGIHQAVVELRDDRLIGYLVAERPSVGGRPSVSELRAGLGETLPDYMIPARYVWLDELPLKSHGKVDRAKLPAPDEERPDQATGYVEPGDDLERAIAEVWAKVLGIARVGAVDDFFDLGGHSLLAAQVVARLRKELPRPVSILDLFKNPTVRGLAVVSRTAGDGRLVHRLTPARRVRGSVVCVPYGGGSAAIYQPLADAMPADRALYAVTVPGHELGMHEQVAPMSEIAEKCVAEILAGIQGPLTLYGHCGLGVMLSVEIARLLEAAGREVEAVYLGGIFPFARPRRGLRRLTEAMEKLQGDRHWANSLRAAGLDVEELGEEELQLVIDNRRRGTKEAEEYFTRLFEEGVEPLRATIIAVAGERDPATEFYQERFREWHRVAPTTALVVLDEAGHFYLKYRAAELAEITTKTHPAIAAGETLENPSWRLHDVSHGVESTGPEPSMKRFSAVAAGQLVSIIGSALTEFAIPIWIYTTTGSLVRFALFSVIALLPGMLVAPLAGAIVDRYDRRRVMMAGDAAAGATQLALGVLLWTGNLQLWHIYPLLVVLSVSLTFQRLAYGSAIPQLVPKRFLGHANGVVQMITGTSQLVVPLVAVGLMAVIGLEGILVIDVVSYTAAVATVLLIRFPAAMAWRRRETLLAEMIGGWRYTWGKGGFRGMLIFFAVLNIFLSPLFLLITPLVLGFGNLQDVGRVAFFGGLGVFLAGLLLTAWGGPRQRRMRGVLLCTLALAGACLVTGLRPDLPVIAAGAFAMSFGLTLLNGIYATVIQVKVPQRFHGRVIALNTLIAWSTLPIGFGLIAPYGGAAFEPLLAKNGPLAGTLGALIGTGPGRGIGLMYLLFAVAIAAIALVAMRVRALARFDADVPDALPDDLIGLQTISARDATAAAHQDRPRPAARSAR